MPLDLNRLEMYHITAICRRKQQALRRFTGGLDFGSIVATRRESKMGIVLPAEKARQLGRAPHSFVPCRKA